IHEPASTLTDRMRPKKPDLLTARSLAKPGRKSLSWMTPCLRPARSAKRASSIASSTVGAVGFSMKMCLPAAIACLTRLGRSPVAAQSMKMRSGPANASSRLCVLLCESGPTAYPQQPGDQPVPFGERKPAFLGDGQEIGHVLGRAHAARGAVDDDADPTIAHVCPLHPRATVIVTGLG